MAHISAVGGSDTGGNRAKTYNEPLRALGWHIAAVTAVVLTVAAVFTVGVVAVLNLGAIPGVITTLVLGCLAAGYGSWLLHGKARP